MTLKLLSYNIHFGGRKKQEQIAQVINAIAPDVVVFQEAIAPDVIEYLSRACGMPYQAARLKHSMGFISRIEIAHYEWHYPRGSKHSFLEIQLSGSETRVFGLHLSARFSKWSERKRHREICALLDGIKQHQHGFHVIVGDFNTLAPGEVFNLHLMPLWIRALIWLSGRDIRRDAIQTMLDAGYLDGFRALYPDDKGYTFPVWQPHVRLDYVFLPARYLPRVKSCEVVREPSLVKNASDHFPLLINLEVE
jgi:endonuclease/exonuclease/phosphatase family metal-dependent hydrolase